MSNIATLPLVRVVGSVETNEDLTFSLTFTLADGVTPLPLAGIAFTLAINYPSLANLFRGSTTDSTLVIGGASGNVLTCTIRAATMALWPVGDYQMTLIATDSAATKGVFADSILSVGETQAWTITTVMPSGSVATGPNSPGGIAPVTTIVSTSQTISASGVYVVTQAGVTLTLNAPATFSGSVAVKDETNAANPNITILGAIDNGTSFVLTTALQSVILAPVAALGIFANVTTGPVPTLLSRDISTGALKLLAPDGSVQFAAAQFSGAVNYLSAQGSPTGGGPSLFASGADTNIDSNYSAKGTGGHYFGSGQGVLGAIVGPAGVPTSVFPMMMGGNGTAVFLTGGPTTTANISVGLLPVGAYGAFAGQGHTATGQYSFAAGGLCSATGLGSVVTGVNATDRGVAGKRVFNSALLGTLKGSTQISEHALAVQTNGTTPGVATSDGGALSATNSIQIALNATLASRVTISARNTSTGAHATWFINASFNGGGTAASVTLDGSTGGGAPAFSGSTGSTWTAVMGVNTTFGCGTVTCTGAAGETVRWTVRVDSAEVTNG